MDWPEKFAYCAEVCGTLVVYAGGARFSLPGGGVDRAPKSCGGGGFGKRAQLTGTINQLLWTYYYYGQFFFTKYMANDDFPIFIFGQFLGLGHL